MEVLSWPPYSPDINIIENVWAYLKDYAEKKKKFIKTRDDLWEHTKKVFLSSECDDLIEKLYKSMPQRIDKLY